MPTRFQIFSSPGLMARFDGCGPMRGERRSAASVTPPPSAAGALPRLLLACGCGAGGCGVFGVGPLKMSVGAVPGGGAVVDTGRPEIPSGLPPTGSPFGESDSPPGAVVGGAVNGSTLDCDSMRGETPRNVRLF